MSRGEIELALRAGIPPQRIVLEGIGKTRTDFELVARLAAKGTPLAWVSLESVEDAAALAAAAGGAQRIDVLVRINPQVTPETHTGLAVGAPESKFGALPEELGAVIDAGGGTRGPLRWRGLHLHVGSQLSAIDAWRAAARIGLRVHRLQRATLPDFDTINFGGGFPVAYESGAESVPSAATFASALSAAIGALSSDARPARMAIEPGRSVVAASGWLVASVLHVRQRGERIVVLDAGMTELVRPAMYGAVHPMTALTSLGRPIATGAEAHDLVRVDGAICEATDSFGYAHLPALERGDLVAIGVVGAYGSSMFSTYNGRPRPPEVAWRDGRLSVWHKRGSIRSLP